MSMIQVNLICKNCGKPFIASTEALGGGKGSDEDNSDTIDITVQHKEDDGCGAWQTHEVKLPK